MRRFCCLLLLAVLLFAACSCLAEDEIIPPQWPVPDYVAHLLEAASDEIGYTEEEHGRTKYGESVIRTASGARNFFAGAWIRWIKVTEQPSSIRFIPFTPVPTKDVPGLSLPAAM